MDVFYVGNEGNIRVDSTNSRNDSLRKLHDIGVKYLHMSEDPHKILTTDMDGVLIVDDNAGDLCKIIAGDEGVNYFGQVSDRNIEAVSQGETSYCWNAPCVFLGSLLRGLPTQINRVIGQNMRFVPGARENIEQLLKLGFDVINVTAGHQEGAEEVSRRLGIDKTIATQFGVEDGHYNGEILRFIGGRHKLHAVENILSSNNQWRGTHVGDSHSDIETMQGHPASIAWNPAHSLAVHSATINVYGNNKQGLTPFYDVNGNLDSQIPTEALPQRIVIYEGRNNVAVLPSQFLNPRPNSYISDKQSEWGQEMRKQYGSQLESDFSYAQMRAKIDREIEETTGMSPRDFQEHVKKVNGYVFLPLDKFQQNALKAYQKL